MKIKGVMARVGLILIFVSIMGCALIEREGLGTTVDIKTTTYRDLKFVEHSATIREGHIIIQGKVKNAHVRYMKNLKVTARVYDAQGQLIATHESNILPPILRPSKEGIFYIEAPIAQEVARVSLEANWIWA